MKTTLVVNENVGASRSQYIRDLPDGTWFRLGERVFIKSEADDIVAFSIDGLGIVRYDDLNTAFDIIDRVEVNIT